MVFTPFAPPAGGTSTGRPPAGQMTVTATQAGVTSNGMSMSLRVLTGASGAAGAAGANAAFGNPQQVALTPQASGSVIYGALFGFTASPTTPNAATQFLQQQSGPGNYAQFRSAGFTAAAVPVTAGLSSANGGIGICAAEVKAAAGQNLSEDPGTPVPTAYSNTVTTMTTAAFAPPPGSVLCLTVTAVGSKGVGSGVTTMAITDTSGLGLTWTEIVKENANNAGYTGVWLALVPTAAAAAYPVIPEVDDRTAAIVRNFSAANKGVVAFMAAIASRDSASCPVAVIGDSITEGMGATAFTSRYAGQAARALRQRYPTLANGSSGGLGFIPMASTGESTYTWPVTTASGIPGAADIGPVRAAATLNGAGSFTFTAPAGTTSVKVMYYNDNSGSQFSYQVNAGAPVTVIASGTVQDGTLTATVPLTPGQVLTVAWVSGTVYLEGLVHYAGDEASGITVHGCGHFGINTAGWIAAQAGGIDWRTSIAALAPAAIAVNLGTNDNAAGISGPATQANLLALITFLRGNAALANVPFLVMVPPACTASAQLWVRGLPLSAGQVQIVDVAYRMPTATLAPALYFDAVHPDNAGHAFIGEVLAAAIGIT